MTLTFDFTGKVVAVTGAGRGLGRITARMYVESGATVAYITKSLYPDLEEEIAGFGGCAALFLTDVSDPAAVAVTFANIADKFGPANILINNAGVISKGKIEDINPEAWNHVVSNNLSSQFYCMQAVIPAMKERKSGKIVNVSSVAGRDKSLLLGCAYTTTKSAILGMTRHAATELGPFGINVNCICPSQHRTPLLGAVLSEEMEQKLLERIPLGYIAEPEQIANVILFLTSDESSFINGAAVDVNGGMF